ncbi:glycosyltransferase family 4 protein [Chamaesiphon sp. OTE_20_metabat_361]|uniref:glycosyltransferase family 4 protein n=1 Tax=Chamaesiphon sp. OTE_20_metabat_361 TaxID=2964689 RepID=UPI00286B2310|nr:glycosyltransferase family 4 protein [Chamaesiphon sp. OTE_20_metabat_361]
MSLFLSVFIISKLTIALFMPHDRKTILYVITKSELGGAQGHVYDLMKSLHRDYQVHLAVGAPGLLTEKAIDLGIKVHIIANLKRKIDPANDLRSIQQCIAIIKSVKPDLVHCHSSKAGVVARIAAWICRVPVIFTAHGWGFDPRSPKLQRNIALGVEKILAPISTKIICVSESDRQLAILLKVTPSKLVVTVHNGIATEAITMAVPERQPPQLIMVARFNRAQKDQHTLMQAIAQIDRPIQLILVGTGPDWEESKNIAKQLGILDRVSFLGDRLDVPDLLADSQIFVLSTHYEGAPISILEAMRCGLPIVATNVNGIPEQVADNVTGLLVPHQDVDALTAAISSLIDDPQRRQQMGVAGRQKFIQEFTVEQMVEKTELVYRSVLSKK